MIDPRRKQQNQDEAAKLLAFQELLEQRMWDGDPGVWETVEGIYQTSRKWRSSLYGGVEEILAAEAAFAAADTLRAGSVQPLKRAIKEQSPVFIVDGREYRPRSPLRWMGQNLWTLIAPLTWHVCLELLADLGKLTILINDPGSKKLLTIERARYASLRTELIRIEHSLWELAAEYGGPCKTIPYPYRLVLMTLAWDPVAHRAPEGAWALCIRCGAPLHRKRNSFELRPRCEPCMKETPAQRQWPTHAVAPHDRGTWLLRCQYPDCEAVFEGPRHRKHCDEHVTSKLAPSRRVANTST